MHIAIYSLNIKIQSRGKGKSAIASASYIAGERFKNEYDGLTHDRTDRNDVVHKEIVLPENAPLDFLDRATLWNAVEKSERAKNAQLCRSVRLALPKELSLEQNINLVHQYVNENFINRGMCADIAIHDKGDGNPHAHILLTMRLLEQGGMFGAKSRMEYILDDNGERQKLPSGRWKVKKITTTDWDDKGNAEIWRKNWADTLNKYLEYHEHEARVDHRSYERQGLEILPTIHLGAVAHAMEQKGIRTERGDRNRAIEKANARLREINGEIRTAKKEQHDILNPPTPKFIIDVQNSIKAQNSVGYEKWATLFNLQQMAKTLIYIQEHGHTDYKSLETANANAINDFNAIIKQRNEIRDKIKDLKALRTVVNEYRSTSKVYNEWNAPGWIPRFKKQHYEKHKDAIEAHKKAKAHIFDEMKLTKFPNLKGLSEEIKQLTETEKRLTDSIPTAREKYKTLNIITHNTRMLLGYDKLEQKGIDPVTDIQNYGHTNGYKNIPVYKPSYIAASNAGETAQYFQCQYLNRECTEAINEAVDLKMAMNNKELDVANRLIETYGIERVKWVLATVIANDPSETFDQYRDWSATMKLPNEPIDKSIFNITGGRAKHYPKFIRAVQIKDAEIRQNKGEKISHENNIAIAKMRADEHNRRNAERMVQTPIVEYHAPSSPRYAPPSTAQQKPTQQTPTEIEIPPPAKSTQQAQQFTPPPANETPPPQNPKKKYQDAR
jgi:hypothetical protein